MKNAQCWPLLSTLPAISTPFATWDPTAQARLTPPVSAPKSTRRVSGFQRSPVRRGGALLLRQSDTLLGWRLNSLICSRSWDVVASCVHVCGLFKMQNKSDLPALPSEVSQPPRLLWDPLARSATRQAVPTPVPGEESSSEKVHIRLPAQE